MANPAGIIVPKNRLLGGQFKSSIGFDRGATLSGASGASGQLLGVMGRTGHKKTIHLLEYIQNGLTGSPRLVVGIKRGDATALATVIGDPLNELDVILEDTLLSNDDADNLRSVDLNAFTDEERTIDPFVGDCLVAAMLGTSGAWTCPWLAVGAEVLESANSEGTVTGETVPTGAVPGGGGDLED